MTTNERGSITISPHAIASVAAKAALTSYGVVGMASKNLIDGITNAIARDPRHGVDVAVVDDEVTVDLYIIIEYGTRIASVATSVANTVEYQVEESIGLPVVAVNVHVQDLRVSDTD
ncbi:MAG: Asp23/Gls24 family envelope stress response protein [Chloroflexi bacterium]|nr:Asp23/Gls24 family envelope stress response protein [Chloroflexota bacterium]MDK1045913.1 Asp23/Gls24 family envelope stress response protein [Anaerolineales bacterium]MCH8877559.1 Asp23/Gls24 family envelope stress response protein [Chloroflexota bacterium]MCI0773978.1 Asp23/Gls24 family envelope stress response protein [Chloroflexota bacterium]MCI0806187.1 Asp23/Gls24 family envelope stress response protein [Chloroflexota bacterium]